MVEQTLNRILNRPSTTSQKINTMKSLKSNKAGQDYKRNEYIKTPKDK